MQTTTPKATDKWRGARLEARISVEQKTVLQQAAALSGRTLSEFVVASAQEAASRVIQEHETIRLSRAEQIAFVSALLIRPRPTRACAKPLRPIANRWSRDCPSLQRRIGLRRSARPTTALRSRAAVRRWIVTSSSRRARTPKKRRCCALRPDRTARPQGARLLHAVSVARERQRTAGHPGQKAGRYPQLPVSLLGRLAADQSMKGKGIGQFLLMDALRRSLFLPMKTVAGLFDD